jgi:hypothetical protein
MEKIIDLRKKENNEIVAGAPRPPQELPSSHPEVISWTGFLYHHDPDMKAVWIAVISFWIIAGLFQYFQKNIITTALMALIGLMILFQAKRKHNNTGEIYLSPLNIKVGQKSYIYSDIKSFWIDYQPESGMEELSLQLKKWYMPYVRIPIDEQNPVRLRDFLIQYIPETKHETTLGEVIARRLGL